MLPCADGLPDRQPTLAFRVSNCPAVTIGCLQPLAVQLEFSYIMEMYNVIMNNAYYFVVLMLLLSLTYIFVFKLATTQYKISSAYFHSPWMRLIVRSSTTAPDATQRKSANRTDTPVATGHCSRRAHRQTAAIRHACARHYRRAASARLATTRNATRTVRPARRPIRARIASAMMLVAAAATVRMMLVVLFLLLLALLQRLLLAHLLLVQQLLAVRLLLGLVAELLERVHCGRLRLGRGRRLMRGRHCRRRARIILRRTGGGQRRPRAGVLQIGIVRLVECVHKAGAGRAVVATTTAIVVGHHLGGRRIVGFILGRRHH